MVCLSVKKCSHCSILLVLLTTAALLSHTFAVVEAQSPGQRKPDWAVEGAYLVYGWALYEQCPLNEVNLKVQYLIQHPDSRIRLRLVEVSDEKGVFEVRMGGSKVLKEYYWEGRWEEGFSFPPIYKPPAELKGLNVVRVSLPSGVYQAYEVVVEHEEGRVTRSFYEKDTGILLLRIVLGQVARDPYTSEEFRDVIVMSLQEVSIPLKPVARAQCFSANWSSIKEWNTYPGWWGSTGVVEASEDVFVSPPFSLHISSRIDEAAYIYSEVPEVDFLSPYNVSFWLYLSSDCDRVIAYQDANLQLVILDNELNVLTSREPVKWVPVAILERGTWYRVTIAVDPTTATAVVSVAGVEVTTRLPPEGMPTSLSSPEGTISWDVIIGDLSHNVGEGDFYIDDLEIVQATGVMAPARPTPETFNYAIELEQNLIRVEKGEIAALKVKVALLSGTPGEVRLNLVRLGGFPVKFPYRFEPPTVVPPGTATLYINTSELEGRYALTVWGQGGGRSVYVVFVLEVLPPFDFEVSITPSEVEVEQGERVTVTVHVDLVEGEAKPVELLVSGLPEEASYALEPSTVVPPGTAELTIDTGEAKGSFHVVVKGVSEARTRTASFDLVIKEKKRCVIATATYGSELAGEVQFLRDFRDNIVLSTASGRRFYQVFDPFYYSWSPYVAQLIADHPELKLLFRALLYPLIASLKLGALAAQPLIPLAPEPAVYVAGTISAATMGAAYLTPLLYLTHRGKRSLVTKLRWPVRYLVAASLALSALLCALGAPPLLSLTTALYVMSLLLHTPLELIGLIERLFT